jgi:hypothetical protein
VVIFASPNTPVQLAEAEVGGDNDAGADVLPNLCPVSCRVLPFHA